MSVQETENKTGNAIVCYVPTMITTNGIWQGDNPLDFSLPLFILQLILVVMTTRLLVFILKPIRQPRVVAEILGGVILGPSVLGRNKKFATTIFPLRSVMMLETMANLGLLYFLFLVGVEMDIAVIRRMGRKSVSIAVGGMILPFIIGCSYTLILHKELALSQGTLILFLGVSMAVTAFPVLARILAELKLLNTEIGKIAMSSALINDICAWILLAIAIALAGSGSNYLTSLWIVLSSVAFVLICIFGVRPAIMWMIQRTPEGENFSDFYICVILTGVMVSGFITDAIGTHSVFGAFVFGLVIPNGSLGVTLSEKLEDFVSGLLLPLFFAISGLKTNMSSIGGVDTWIRLICLIIVGCAGKVGGTTLIARFYKMSFREAITLGLLMNTKGLIEMIILNLGRDQKVLDDKTFAAMVVTAIIMTGIITPAVTFVYRPARKRVTYKQRTIMKAKRNSELRMLTCIHTPRNVPTIINLLDASNPTKRSPICVYVLHLLELTGHASAMLIVHNSRKSEAPNRAQPQSDHIFNAFENYEECVGFVSIQPLTAISPYSMMHDDICNVAEDKRVAFMILPFHKQQTVDGGLEATNPAFRDVNQNVLANAPCSVGILVDRGLHGSTRMDDDEIAHHIAVLFFGGPDDREALAYARRMSSHPRITITVLRFIAGDETAGSRMVEPIGDPRGAVAIPDIEKDVQFDEEYINEFKTETANDDSVTIKEVTVNNGEETVAAIRSIDTAHDLYIVGRGQGIVSPLTAGLTAWSECPELGPIGDLLASSDFAATISVLVVQQYIGSAVAQADDARLPDSPFAPHGDETSEGSEEEEMEMERNQWQHQERRSHDDDFNP
ncbi:hypothetical protein V2J09_021894 [Rumex salicifolius]